MRASIRVDPVTSDGSQTIVVTRRPGLLGWPELLFPTVQLFAHIALMSAVVDLAFPRSHDSGSTNERELGVRIAIYAGCILATSLLSWSMFASTRFSAFLFFGTETLRVSHADVRLDWRAPLFGCYATLIRARRAGQSLRLYNLDRWAITRVFDASHGWHMGESGELGVVDPKGQELLRFGLRVPASSPGLTAVVNLGGDATGAEGDGPQTSVA